MKRLKLEDFKAKKLTNQADETTESKVDQLLGQVLGDCHDDDIDNNNGGDRGGDIFQQNLV
ncbi:MULTISPECIES: hypothetical protein [unclassified Aureispira]|uniref:hypothetical protein n=1 Tax=unclassified Aureispira TaxID=2649989 RepID=UPI00069850FD|nr:MULTISPECIES: hypothetical protein [unclassified Aureispira]WMX14208.1 hypothetical protein QP953_25455 [Aureispira sp. CCB-E]